MGICMQVELRVLAHLCGDERLLGLLTRGGTLDFFEQVAVWLRAGAAAVCPSPPTYMSCVVRSELGLGQVHSPDSYSVLT